MLTLETTKQQRWIVSIPTPTRVKTFDVIGDYETAEYHAQRLAFALETVEWEVRAWNASEMQEAVAA